jgi:hypothetical protein
MQIPRLAGGGVPTRGGASNSKRKFNASGRKNTMLARRSSNIAAGAAYGDALAGGAASASAGGVGLAEAMSVIVNSLGWRSAGAAVPAALRFK